MEPYDVGRLIEAARDAMLTSNEDFEHYDQALETIQNCHDRVTDDSEPAYIDLIYEAAQRPGTVSTAALLTALHELLTL